MPEYARICLNLSGRLLFYISLLQSLSSLKACLLISTFTQNLRFYSEGKWGCFLGDKIWFFSVVDVRVLFGVCFRQNTFTSKITNLLSALGRRGLGFVNLDIPYFSLHLLVALVYFYFVLKHSVDEKIYKIFTSKFT